MVTAPRGEAIGKPLYWAGAGPDARSRASSSSRHEGTSCRSGSVFPTSAARSRPGRLLQVAQRADARGLDSLWVTDHVIVPKDVYIAYREEMLDPLAVLAVARGRDRADRARDQRDHPPVPVSAPGGQAPRQRRRALGRPAHLWRGGRLDGGRVRGARRAVQGAGQPDRRGARSLPEGVDGARARDRDAAPPAPRGGRVADAAPAAAAARSGSAARARARTAAWRATATAGTRPPPRRRRSGRAPTPCGATGPRPGALAAPVLSLRIPFWLDGIHRPGSDMGYLRGRPAIHGTARQVVEALRGLRRARREPRGARRVADDLPGDPRDDRRLAQEVRPALGA